MSKLKPTNDSVLLEAVMPTKHRAEEVKKRSGILLGNPDQVYSFEGIPNRGKVYELPDQYDGDLSVGQTVAFSDKSPKGFRLEGLSILRVRLCDVIAIIEE